MGWGGKLRDKGRTVFNGKGRKKDRDILGTFVPSLRIPSKE